MTEAPRLSAASVRALGVGIVRVVLGVAFVLGSVPRGLHGGSAVLAAVGGALILVLIVQGQRGRSGPTDFSAALPVPDAAQFDPRWMGVLLACIPSTIGVTAMALISIVFTPALAAVLGGVLIALGVLALWSWMQLVYRERAEEKRYWLERGPRPRLFVTR